MREQDICRERKRERERDRTPIVPVGHGNAAVCEAPSALEHIGDVREPPGGSSVVGAQTVPDKSCGRARHARRELVPEA